MRDTSMGAAQYRKAMAKLAFNHHQMSAALGVNERSSRRYASGAQTISIMVANAVRNLLERETDSKRHA